jgi:hypothetical protein
MKFNMHVKQRETMLSRWLIKILVQLKDIELCNYRKSYTKYNFEP